jgi:hypothetical protein
MPAVVAADDPTSFCRHRPVQGVRRSEGRARANLPGLSMVGVRATALRADPLDRFREGVEAWPGRFRAVRAHGNGHLAMAQVSHLPWVQLGARSARADPAGETAPGHLSAGHDSQRHREVCVRAGTAAGDPDADRTRPLVGSARLAVRAAGRAGLHLRGDHLALRTRAIRPRPQACHGKRAAGNAVSFRRVLRRIGASRIDAQLVSVESRSADHPRGTRDPAARTLACMAAPCRGDHRQRCGRRGRCDRARAAAPLLSQVADVVR